jgi:hypothetical protein
MTSLLMEMYVETRSLVLRSPETVVNSESYSYCRFSVSNEYLGEKSKYRGRNRYLELTSVWMNQLAVCSQCLM